MESKWYFFPDQDEKKTKISDRPHALHISKKCWNQITGHLDKKRLLAEAMEREREHKRYLKEGSKAMTKEWPNSVENVRMRQELERKKRFSGKKDDDKMQLFYKMKAEQDAIRQQYLDKVKKNMFISKGYPKQLTSALILAQTIDERKKQQEFNKIIQAHNDDVERKFAEKVWKEAAEEKQEKEEEKNKAATTRKIYGIVLKNQIESNRITEEEQRRKHMEKEADDNVRANEEMEIMKRLNLEEKLQKRRQIRDDTYKDIMEEKERQQIRLREDKESDNAAAIYAEAKSRIDCLMKTKAKEQHEAEVAKREQIALKVAAIADSKDEIENERIRVAIAERDAQDEIKKKAKAEYDARMIKERLEDRQQYLDRLAHEKQQQKELERWEMLNRFKSDEAIKKYNKAQQNEKWRKILEYRKTLLDQVADDKEARRQFAEIEEIMSQVHYEAEDKMFFDYATEVRDLAKAKGWPTYAIEKVIERFHKANGVVFKSKRCQQI